MQYLYKQKSSDNKYQVAVIS